MLIDIYEIIYIQNFNLLIIHKYFIFSQKIPNLYMPVAIFRCIHRFVMEKWSKIIIMIWIWFGRIILLGIKKVSIIILILMLYIFSASLLLKCMIFFLFYGTHIEARKLHWSIWIFIGGKSITTMVYALVWWVIFSWLLFEFFLQIM